MPKLKPSISIRAAKLKDLPRLAEMGISILKYHQQLDDYFKPSKNAKKIYLSFFKKCIYSRKNLLLVATDQDHVIGYSLANLNSRPPVFEITKIGVISDMYIEPNYRKQGLSKEFLQKTYAWFKNKKIHHVHLVYHFKNELGEKAWTKHGFKQFMSYNRIKI